MLLFYHYFTALCRHYLIPFGYKYFRAKEKGQEFLPGPLEFLYSLFYLLCSFSEPRRFESRQQGGGIPKTRDFYGVFLAPLNAKIPGIPGILAFNGAKKTP